MPPVLKVTGRELTVSDSTRKRNPDLYGPLNSPSLAQNCPITGDLGPGKGSIPPKAPKRIRQGSKPLMNKLEGEFHTLIKDQYPNYPPVRPQAKRYRIGNGLTYTPDFTCSAWPAPIGEVGPSMETAWEVKGPHSWDDSIAKLKAAAAIWPEVRFILVWKQDGQWQSQTILP